MTTYKPILHIHLDLVYSTKLHTIQMYLYENNKYRNFSNYRHSLDQWTDLLDSHNLWLQLIIVLSLTFTC
jgi:hypothetical protein